MRKIWIFIAVFVILLIPVKAFAFETQAGFTIPDNEYVLLSSIHTPEYIYTMSYDEYMYLQSLNIVPENVKRISKYYKVVTNNLTKEVDKVEITEEEYEEYEVPENNRSLTLETAYEKIMLTFLHNSDASNYFSITGRWKSMPSVRSYDDIGGRFIGFNIVTGSQVSRQIYTLNGNVISINYPYNGINTKTSSNGYGVSMGLTGSSVTTLECTTSASLIVSFYPAFVFGAYEHAINTITLNTAKDYTIGNGAGGVFVWGSNAYGNYDGMSGLSTYITS